MTATQATQTFTILGEEFEMDELQDIATHGANTGVHGFTYSSDLFDKYEENEDEINDYLEQLGYEMAEVFATQEFETLQQYREWACWVYLEAQAATIIDS